MNNNNLWRQLALASCLAFSLPPVSQAAGETPADLVVTDARIYTADAAHTMAQALAVRGGKLVFVGSAAEVQHWIGPKTEVRKLHGQLVLPGLFDSHTHPIAIVKEDVCNLDSKTKTLAELSEFVKACVQKYKPPAGSWLNVHQWNYTDGNEPDAEHPTILATLDKASTTIPIQLLGNDGHHGGYNSVALALAHDANGVRVGLTKATLAKDFSEYHNFIGVDANGNPNGAVNEGARWIMDAPDVLFSEFPRVMQDRIKLPQALNEAGITGFLDALVTPESAKLYDALERDGHLTARATLAQYFDPEVMKKPNGQVDFDTMLATAKRIRAQHEKDPLIRADVVKLFADGVMEGNPYAVPPTLPNTLSLRPYHQPIFGKDKDGKLTVTGYVDTASKTCVDVRANPARYAANEAVATFMKEHGYHPAQCAISSGQLYHDPAVIKEFVKRFHTAGFTLHVHVIGDGSLKVILDALEAARAADGISTQHDGLAHVQLAQPSDVARIGRDHLYVAFTYSWADVDLEYDMTVIPFIEKVSGNTFAALHAPGSYYEQNVYPFKGVKDAGGTLVAGSDAPVNTADPQPFVNMAMAVTRRLPGGRQESPQQAISIRDVLDAYTINGARFLNRDRETGSLETGKSADFVIVDQDILQLADRGDADRIATTRVLETWFQGKRVYERGTPAAGT
ncbi:MAG TPA: amidohydrolase family protein [Steroidobacteraceae bacterium]|nr:amidohydrolase family protein [Steroidobacteraceae bacterium]